MDKKNHMTQRYTHTLQFETHSSESFVVLFLPRHMPPLTHTLPFPGLPHFPTNLLLSHRNIGISLDKLLNPLPKSGPGGAASFRRHHQITKLCRRNERVWSGHWIRIVKALLLGQRGAGKILESLPGPADDEEQQQPAPLPCTSLVDGV